MKKKSQLSGVKDLSFISGKTLLIMKLTVFLFFCSLVQLVASTSYAQDTRLNLQLSDVSIEEALRLIEDQSEFFFLYNHKLVDVNRKVDIKAKNKKIKNILDDIFKGTDVDYLLMDRQIVLSPQESIDLTLALELINVKGKVTDSNNESIPGVNVSVKGTSIGTTTDVDGNYSLDVPDDGILVFSFVGYVAEEIPVNGQTTINVTLIESLESLEEIVIVGFGSQKRENVTGAVSSIKMDEVLADRPLTNSASAIQGTVPGLQVLSGSGRPGSDILLSIRGVATINGGSPLVIVNNVPMEITDINPRDIETITVLKDAAATSIYGGRAAFGVILITTKKGARNQETKVRLSTSTSFNYPTELPQKASVYDFVSALNDWGVESFWTDQLIPTWLNELENYKLNPENYPDGKSEVDGVHYPLTETNLYEDFYGEVGSTQIYNLSITGGGERSAYRIATGYTDEDGIIVTENDRFKKYTINTDYSIDLTSKITASMNMNYLNSFLKEPIGDYYRAITYPAFASKGDFEMPDGRLIPYDTPGNLEKLRIPRKEQRDNLRFFTKLEYNPTENTSLVGEYTYGYKTFEGVSVNNEPQTVDAVRQTLNVVKSENTYYFKGTHQSRYNGVNLYGKQKLSFSNHQIEVFAGFNSEINESTGYYVSRNDLIDPSLPSISQAIGTVSGGDGFGGWSVMGYFGRLNYNFNDKYFLELNGRYDGSSRFPKDDRWGFFPSASVGWNIARESFMEPIQQQLSQLKLRASYGEIGNQEINVIPGVKDLYPSIPGLGSYPSSWIDPGTGVLYTTLSSPRLVADSFIWETVKTLNFGLDFGLLNNRLNGSFDWFIRETLDMIARGAIELPSVLGTVTPTQNVADLKTKGWELEMRWKDKIRDFSYYISLNLADNQTEITKFDNEEGLLGSHYVGKKIGEIWGFETDGYYTVDDFVDGTLNADLMHGTLLDGVTTIESVNPNPGDIKYKDLNGDGIINWGNNTLDDPGDIKIIGNSTRRYQYGIKAGGSYKNFDLSVFVQGIGKRDLWINNDVVWPYRGEFSIVFDHQLDYWTPDNTDAYYPRNYDRGGENYGSNIRTQTKYLADGSYIRLKNITLGYTIPNDIFKKSFFESLRISVSAENLINHDNLPDGINAELDNLGQGGNYPFLKQFAFGLNITF